MKDNMAVFLSIFALLASPAFTQSEWKAGVSEANITPQEPVFLAGYAARNKPSQGKLTDLYAKVLALEDREGRRAVLVTADLIGFRAEFVEPLYRQIRAQMGLERGQILLNASHTHTGPVVTLNPRPGGNMSAQEASKVVAYTERLNSQIVEAVSRALANLQPAELAWGVGTATFVMNRREHTDGGVILGVNPRGLVDRSVPVLRVTAPDEKLRAVVFGAACHNTTLTGRHYQISGDYAGLAQQHIQSQLPSVQAMFMLGCGGDANPYPRGTVEWAREHGESLGKEVLRVLKGELKPIRGPLNAELDYVDLPLQEPLSREEIEKMSQGRGWQAWVGTRMKERMDRGESLPSSYTAPVAVWQFGSDLTLLGLPGETVVDYVSRLEKALGPLRLWVAGYCNDVFGYLPSARILSEGGYETRGLTSGGVGLFDPRVEDVLVEKVIQLARRAGRFRE